jgi:hypothetical protein
MELINAIASILKVSPNQIKSVDEWKKVYFVRFNVGRPTFVSKRQAKTLMPLTFTLDAGRRGSKPWVARITGAGGGQYGFARQFVEPTSIEWAGKKGCKSASFALSEVGIYQDSDSGYYRVLRGADGALTFEDMTYQEVKYVLGRQEKAVAFAGVI